MSRILKFLGQKYKIAKAEVIVAFTLDNYTSRPIYREIQKIAFAIVLAQIIIAASMHFAVKYDLDRFLRPTVTVYGSPVK